MRTIKATQHPIAALATALCLASITAGPVAAAPGLFSTQAGFYTEVNHLLSGPASGDHFGHALATGDFNGDAVADLATGIPYDDNYGGQYPDSGVVVVRHGVRGIGLAKSESTILSQMNGGSPDAPYGSDEFGWALASGDFNGDGFADLAVGIRYNRDSAGMPTGGVQIHYGSSAGLDPGGSQIFSRTTPGIPGSNEFQDQFGTALAAGDFDRDGYADLAIGHPNYGSDFDLDCGRVIILYGSRSGLTTSRTQMFTQDTPGMDGANESNDHFGYSLAAGDFNGDGRADLAVGVPGENDFGGGVHFILGSDTGLTVAGNNLWTQDDAGVLDTNEHGDNFGVALAASDFNDDGFDDLAIAAPYEDLELPGGVTLTDAGVVHLFFGSAAGISSASSRLWSESDTGLGTSEAYDVWGQALAAGDFDHDGYADLAVAAPGEYVGSIPAAGEVTILRGYVYGLTAWYGQVWTQDSPGVPDASESGDVFGRALAAGDFDGNGYADLAIGAPLESTETFSGNGAEWVLYGYLFADGLETGNTTQWQATQSSTLKNSNRASANTAARLGSPFSQYGLQINLFDGAGNSAWVMAGPARGFADETRLTGSFFIDPQGVAMSSVVGLNSFQMMAFADGTGTGAKTRLLFHLNRGTANDWNLTVAHWNDDLNSGAGGFQFSGGFFLAPVNDASWHNVRVDYEWLRGNPGHLTMWRTRYINGVPDSSGRVQMLSVDLPGTQSAVINYVYAGMFASQDPGTFGVLYLDELSFSR